MNTNNSIKRIIFSIIGVSFLLISVYLFIDASFYKSIKDFFGVKQEQPVSLFSFSEPSSEVAKKEAQMTVFVHGSFGSLIGLLSFTRVIKDDLYGSLYKDINKKMRQDPFFYKDQPMLQRGLVQITPTFDIETVEKKKYAAYPIIKAYEIIEKELGHMTMTSNDNASFFYTFGWSGLMSQHRRRLESIRLYNCLTEESDRLKALGYIPKIRLIAHSHGGNLCLNLAAINHIMSGNAPLEIKNEQHKKEMTDSLAKMLELINSLPHKPQIEAVQGQRHYDYAPVKNALHVEELVALGAPIQPETEFFCLSDMFTKFYNVYSDDDAIQGLDGVTTKQYKSEQRLPKEICELSKNSKIVQVKIMYGRALKDESTLEIDALQKAQEDQAKKDSIWKKITGIWSIFSKKYKDPGHKELWFASWKNDSDPKNSFIAPMPTVVLTPMFIAAINRQASSDVDINVALSGGSLLVSMCEHNDNKVTQLLKLPAILIEDLKQKFNSWNPQDVLDNSGIESIYKYLM